MPSHEFTTPVTPQIDGQQSHEATFSAQDRQHAFERLDAATTPQEAAIEQKRSIVRTIHEGELLRKDILKNFPTIYAGSGIDIEYPLALGCRHIVMVDPGFSDIGMAEELRAHIQVLIGDKPINQTEQGFLFDFNFDGEDEQVFVTLAPQYYNPEKPTSSPFMERPSEPIPDSQRYVLPERTGMILGFASHYEPIEQSDIDKLVPGGAILDPSLYKIALDITDEEYDTFWAQQPNESSIDLQRRQQEFARGKWTRMGLGKIDIGDEVASSFFIKQGSVSSPTQQN
jgi:hypothetical protein